MISPVIEVPADGRRLDCRELRCAVVTRADHKALTDRSRDLFVPVTFAASSPAGPTPTTVPPAPPAPSTTAPALQPAQIAPSATVEPDGLAVTDGTRRLAADQVADLDPDGADVVVRGQGFDAGKGVYVGLCAIPSPDPNLPAGAAPAPGPCSAPAEGGAAWVSSNPPGYAADAAEPYSEGGSFRQELELRAVIDADHDCRVVRCALVTRHDDTNRDDRTQDLYLPVTFAAASPRADAERAMAVGADAEADGGSSAAPMVAGGVGFAAVGALGLAWRRRRRGALA